LRKDLEVSRFKSGQMASHLVDWADGFQFRFLDGADGFGFKEAGMKPAPRGGIKGTGDLTRQYDRLTLNVRAGGQSGRIKGLDPSTISRKLSDNPPLTSSGKSVYRGTIYPLNEDMIFSSSQPFRDLRFMMIRFPSKPTGQRPIFAISFPYGILPPSRPWPLPKGPFKSSGRSLK
jgi:hypothetical protein